MPQSLAQIYLHTIFSTKDRFPFFRTPELQAEVHAYLAGVVKTLGCVPVRIGGVSDHVHLLTGLSRTITIADFVKETKRVSTLWLHERGGDWANFHWQAGYGTFSVSESKVADVKHYIGNQAEHHRKETFQDEFRRFLDRHRLAYDERYVWD